jgi:hypothetical protein
MHAQIAIQPRGRETICLEPLQAQMTDVSAPTKCVARLRNALFAFSHRAVDCQKIAQNLPDASFNLAARGLGIICNRDANRGQQAGRVWEEMPGF